MIDVKWKRPADELPEKGRAVEWLNAAGKMRTGRYVGVWLTDGGMYIYYTPTFWRYRKDDDDGC